MIDKFKVTLCCPAPRIGFGPGDFHLENELDEMERFVSESTADFVVFPEGFLTDAHVKEAEKIASRFNKWLIAGSQLQQENKELYTDVISPRDGLVYRHQKTSLTEGDRLNNAHCGRSIEAFETPFCKIGTVLCYEIHFPEVARIEAIDGARVLFNTIGTGMWHDQQLYEWTTVAKARAIENRCFVLGCTHYCDPIPLIFAYDPHGRQLALVTNQRTSVTVDIDLSLIDDQDFLRDRTPAVYGKLSEVKKR
ncbi:MAG: carbon-nitrogen hydrolase family protein [Erysipelotrichaceae bacterium]|nr:carbon-nitrogen hydrolase family protein [Erysipelotrichaceae bacterium]